ncbi:MAG TPA: lysozyme inhibitor LprI family protein [Chthoniobacterales bacterium]
MSFGFLLALLLARLAVAEDAGDTVLARAPSGAFSLAVKADGGPIWLVAGNGLEHATQLPPVRVTAHKEDDWSAGLKDMSSDEVGDPTLAFISPDEHWIFVQMAIESEYGIGFLYRRTNDAPSAPVFEVAAAERLDVLAARFFSAEMNVPEAELAVVDSFGNRDFRVRFGGWSADSARLLLGLSGGIGTRQEPMLEFPRTVDTWLCYFNTRTATFELTARLRSSNRGRFRAPNDLSADAQGGHAVLEAEAIGQEGMPPLAQARFENADRELNEIYRRVLTATPPAAKSQLQDEQRRWLNHRDLAGAIHANQSWSLFPGDSRIEGEAIATEARVSELKTRLATQP